MNREPLPIIALQASIIVVDILGFLWVFNFPNIHNSTFYVSLGILVIIASPIISQFFYGIWKILGGFSFFDFSKNFLHGVPFTKKWMVQTTFDRFWHNKDIDEVVIEYTRRRSAVCQLNLFGGVVSVPSALFFLVIVVYLCLNNPSELWKALVLLGIFIFLSIIFLLHLGISSTELREMQGYYLKNDLEEIQEQIDIKLGKKVISNKKESLIDQVIEILLNIKQGYSKSINSVKNINEIFDLLENIKKITSNKKHGK